MFVISDSSVDSGTNNYLGKTPSKLAAWQHEVVDLSMLVQIKGSKCQGYGSGILHLALRLTPPAAEQEALFGSKPSPMKQHNNKPRVDCLWGDAGLTSNIKLSCGGAAAHATPKPDVHSTRGTTPNTRTGKKIDRHLNKKDDRFGSMSTGKS